MTTAPTLVYGTNESSYKWGYSVGNGGGINQNNELLNTCDKSAILNVEPPRIVSKRPKLTLEHAEDYEKKKKIVDNYKKVSAALLKKNSIRI